MTPPRVLISRLKARNRRVMHVVGPGYFGQGLSGVPPSECLVPLVDGELRLPSKPDASRPRALAPLSRTGPDQLSLEFREPAQHREHEPAVRRFGRPSLRVRVAPPLRLRSRAP